MTDVVRVNATLDRELLDRVDRYASCNHEDRSTAIRQLLHLALRELAKREGFEAFRGGRLTVRELARLLGLDVWATHDLLAAGRNRNRPGHGRRHGNRPGDRPRRAALTPR